MTRTPPGERSVAVGKLPRSRQSDTARLAFYSHDAQGLGHLRRNLNIANSLIGAGLDITVLLICGSRRISHFHFAGRIDTLILPSLRKYSDGHYQPRHLSIEQARLVELRKLTIRSAIEAFDPDILLVDKLPLGFGGELLPTLELMRQRPGSSILGLRDIIDEPLTAREEWGREAGNEAVESLYDQVWIYGDRSVYDLTDDYQFSDQTLLKTHFTGYLNPWNLNGCSRAMETEIPPRREQAGQRTVLCLVGGGQDGYDLARLFLKSDLGKNRQGIIVTGPFMSEAHREKLKAKARKREQFKVVDFLASLLPLMQTADQVVSLGGYNTLCEIVSLGIPALVIPRVVPRREQLVRAQVFNRLGLVDYIHPDDVNSAAISDWISRKNQRRVNGISAINFTGFATIQRQTEMLLAAAD